MLRCDGQDEACYRSLVAHSVNTQAKLWFARDGIMCCEYVGFTSPVFISRSFGAPMAR